MINRPIVPRELIQRLRGANATAGEARGEVRCIVGWGEKEKRRKGEKNFEVSAVDLKFEASEFGMARPIKPAQEILFSFSPLLLFSSP